MSCGELQNSPNAKSTAGFSGPVTLRIDGNKAILDRTMKVGQEHLEGIKSKGKQLQLEGQGWLYARADRPWKVRTTLIERGSGYEGSAVFESLDGQTRYRDCSVALTGTESSEGNRTAAQASVTRQPNAVTANSKASGSLSPTPPSLQNIVKSVPAVASKAQAIVVEIPQQPTGRITDLGHILSEKAVKRLTQLSDDYERETTHQIFVLTVPSLGGETIENFSLRIARQWALGRKNVDNGILVTVARDDRKVRIGLGAGFTKYISDARAKEIIDTQIVPNFKSGKFDQGLELGMFNLMQDGRQFVVPRNSAGNYTKEPEKIPAIVATAEQAKASAPVNAASRPNATNSIQPQAATSIAQVASLPSSESRSRAKPFTGTPTSAKVLYKFWQVANPSEPGRYSDEFISGEILYECSAEGKYPAKFGLLKVKTTFDMVAIKDPKPFAVFVGGVDYGTKLVAFGAQPPETGGAGIIARLRLAGCSIPADLAARATASVASK